MLNLEIRVFVEKNECASEKILACVFSLEIRVFLWKFILASDASITLLLLRLQSVNILRRFSNCTKLIISFSIG